MPNDKQNDESAERALIPVGPRGVELRDVDAMFRFARCYLQSGLAPGSFKNEQQLVICWAKAAELGLSPLQAVDGMAVINNRVGLMGDLALAMVEASGLLVKKHIEFTGEGADLECRLTLQRKGRDPNVYTFSVREARAAGIYERSMVWRSYPKRMTYYRALGFGLRDEFADVLKGTKTIEELQDYDVPETYIEPKDIDDEAKVKAARKHDQELKAAGTKFVEPTRPEEKQPTPKQAVEPLFEEDKRPPKFERELVEEQDDLDMDAPPAQQAPVGTGVEKAAAGLGSTPTSPAAVPTQEPSPDAWKDHIIRSFSKTGPGAKFHQKRMGDLSPQLISIIEEQWLPQIRKKWDDTDDDQKLDFQMFERAVEYYKLQRPW